MIFLLLLVLWMADPAREANKAYEAGDFEVAVQLYQQAIVNNPEEARLYFNLGNALAKLGRYDEAGAAYEQFKAMQENAALAARADYNTGNLLTEQQQWEAAAKKFKETLRQNPGDQQARFNYELALRKQQEQEQNQDQDQDQQQNQDKNQQQQQNQNDQQNQQQKNQEQNQDQNQQKQDQKQPNDGEQKPDKQQQMQNVPISPKEAEQMLKALENKEKDLLKKLKKQKAEPPKPNEKDW